MNNNTDTNNETMPETSIVYNTAPKGYARKKELMTIYCLSPLQLKQIIDNHDIPHVDVLDKRPGTRYTIREVNTYYKVDSVKALFEKDKTTCDLNIKIDGKDYPVSPELKTQIEALILDNIKYNTLHTEIDKILAKQDELPFGGGFADSKTEVYPKNYLPLANILLEGKTKTEVSDVLNRIKAILRALNIKTLDQNGKKLYHVPSTCYILKVKGFPFREGLRADAKKVKYLWVKDIIPYIGDTPDYKKATAILTSQCPKKPKEKGEGKSKIGNHLYNVKHAKRLLKANGLKYNPNL